MHHEEEEEEGTRRNGALHDERQDGVRPFACPARAGAALLGELDDDLCRSLLRLATPSANLAPLEQRARGRRSARSPT